MTPEPDTALLELIVMTGFGVLIIDLLWEWLRSRCRRQHERSHYHRTGRTQR